MDCASDCNKALEACDQALEAKDELIQKYTSALDGCNKQVIQLSVDLEKIQAEKSAWYRNPLVVGLLGVVTGFVASQLLK
jgi:chromosome segregation ATPase